MSNNSLIIHPDQYKDQMICSICATPGACCSGFNLYGSDGYISTMEDATALLKELGLPFTADDVCDCDDGVSKVIFSCTKLTADGRCSIYEKRPSLCRWYRSLTDNLCKMTLILR